VATGKTNPMIVVLLLAVIAAAIALGVVLSKKPKVRERQRYDYTIFAIASDETIYKWTGHSPKWPIVYQGKELLPLYVCENGHRFAGNAGAPTTECPVCHSPHVGSYDEETHGALDAMEIKIESPQ
jgi:hypothetical protein